MEMGVCYKGKVRIATEVARKDIYLVYYRGQLSKQVGTIILPQEIRAGP